MVCKILWVSITIVQTGNLKPCEIEACAVCDEGHPVPFCTASSGKGRTKKEAEVGNQWVKR